MMPLNYNFLPYFVAFCSSLMVLSKNHFAFSLDNSFNSPSSNQTNGIEKSVSDSNEDYKFTDSVGYIERVSYLVAQIYAFKQLLGDSRINSSIDDQSSPLNESENIVYAEMRRQLDAIPTNEGKMRKFWEIGTRIQRQVNQIQVSCAFHDFLHKKMK